MKLLLLLVSVIAVFTMDSRGFPDKPGDGDPIEYGLDYPEEHRYADQDQLFTGKPDGDLSADESQIIQEEPDFLSFTETQLPDSSDVEQQILKDGENRKERALRDSQCEANVICGILGGSCIANTTVCSGWLVSEGCKGTNCKCCIPGSLEIKMKNFGLELQSLKDDLTKSSLQQTKELKSMIANITNTNAGLKKQIQSFTESKVNASSNFESQLNNLTLANLELNKKLTLSNVELNKKLDSLEDYDSNHGCQKGTSWFAPSDQCFKFMTSRANWATADNTCKSQGLELAKPLDPVALRAYVIDRYTYISHHTWLGAKGSGSAPKWTRDGQTIRSDSYRWHPSGYSASTSYCLTMIPYPPYLKTYYNSPYYMAGCTSSHTSMCEYVRK